MKTKIYKSALIRLEWKNEGIRRVMARKIFLKSAPNRIFFAHKNSYGNFTITEAYSGAIVVNGSYKETLESLIDQANYKIQNQTSDKFKSFDDLVEDYVLRNNYLPFRTNIKTFAN